MRLLIAIHAGSVSLDSSILMTIPLQASCASLQTASSAWNCKNGYFRHA